MEGGSSTSLSSATGFSHQSAVARNDGRGDIARARDMGHRLEHRHKYAGGTMEGTGSGSDHDRAHEGQFISMDVNSSATNSLSDIAPVLQERGNSRDAGVGAEESSDDEMGSVVSFKFFADKRILGT